MMGRQPPCLYYLLLNSLSGSPVSFHRTLRETQWPISLTCQYLYRYPLPLQTPEPMSRTCRECTCISQRTPCPPTKARGSS